MGGNKNALKLMCAECFGAEPFYPDIRLTHSMFLHQLQESGYPFEKNDLTIEEWKWIGELKSANTISN